jgi:hypothetical protein
MEINYIMEENHLLDRNYQGIFMTKIPVILPCYNDTK